MLEQAAEITTGIEEQNKVESDYFFGDCSSVGQKVTLLKYGHRNKKERSQAIIVVDTKTMVVVKYLKQGYREAFTKADFACGQVRLTPNGNP